MEKLSDLVSRDYEEEVEIIRAAGTLWKKFLEGGAALLVAWGLSFLNGSPWGPRTQAFALLAFFTVPFALRAWDRSKVAQEMRHHREVRMEIKINALLGIVSIKDDPDDDNQQTALFVAKDRV